MADCKTIIYEIKDDIGWLTLNRPDKLNAINDEMLDELDDVFDLAEQDLDVKVLVVKGAGKAFSVGQDLSGVGTDEVLPGRKLSGKEALEASRRRNRRWEHVFNVATPTIAQVHGHCMGAGMYLALCCDLTISSDDAQFGDPSILHGIVPDFPLLPWLVGIRRAASMMLSGNNIDGKKAEAWGLINRSVPQAKLDDEVMKLAKGISLLHSDALAIAKDSVNAAMEARGVGAAWRFTSDLGVMMQRRTIEPDELDFEEVRAQKGLKAAIEARDAAFKNLY